MPYVTASAPARGDLPLGPYRVLDLSGERALLCGKVLGDLGADVIKIERPRGDASRNIGPFAGDVPHPERSLYWLAFNTNKRGITLDIETADGKELFKRLVKTADFVIESFAPGYMESIGLGYETLSLDNPGLIMTSVAPFGQSGPYRDYRDSDLVVWALSGIMSLCGDADRAPVRTSFGQSAMHAGAGAATASLVALYSREIKGTGQHIDVSMQEMSIPVMLSNRLFWDLNREDLKRDGPYRVGLSSTTKQRLSWQCKDGYVCFMLVGSRIGARSNRALVEWLDEEGLATDYLRAKDWVKFDQKMVDQPEIDRILKPVGEFFLRHTKTELYDGAVERHIQLYPVYTIEDIFKDPQLSARQFWATVEHPELGKTITYPGAFAHLSETPCRIWRRAPLIGEHNLEVYGELGLSRQDVVMMKQAGII